jgi:T5SS/PEP-CTERM-associated repeat protein
MKPLSLLLGLLAFTASIRAQLVNDGATNTLVNVTNTVAGTLTVGTNGSFTLLVFSNNVLVTNTGRGIIGLNPTAKSNEVRVISPTARWVTGVMSVGSNGPSSRLVISGGGQVADSGAIVGRREPASNCTAIVTGPGSLWTHADGVLLGQSSGGNQLVVSNGATMISPYSYAGDGGSENKTVVTGTGSHWTNDTDFVVGWGGSSNQLLVANGGRVSDGLGTVGLSVGAVNNEAIISDTGSLWSNRLDLIVGQDGSKNRLVVSNGASVVAKSNIVAGLNFSAVSNTIVLTGPGTSLQTGVVLNRLIIGSNAPFNRLVISNGATATAFFSEIGSSATSGTNEAVVTGTGSVWRTTVDMGVGKSGAGNRLTISDGGLVSCPDGFVGVNPSGSNNFAVVTGPGSMWSNRFNFFAGYQGANNQVIISNGAMVSSDSATLGNDPTSKGNSLLVTGVGSMLSNGATLFVGGFGAANQLTTDVGAKVHNQNASVGFRSVSSNNNVLVSGVGTFWTTAGSLVVGDSGSGNRMTVTNGATVLSSNLFIGLNASSTGNCVIVDSGGLFLTNSAGNGLLEIRRGTNVLNGGVVEADILRMTNGVSSVLDFNGGMLVIKNSQVSVVHQLFIGDGINPATLHLAGNGTHDFNGTNALTIASHATLSGSGTLLAQFFMQLGATLSPGASSIGKISGITNAFLGGTAVMEISKNGGVLASDQFQVTGTLTYGGGGWLIVTNLGPTALTDGDNFPLFSATNYTGSFFTITLPPLNPGLMWTNRLLVDGSLQVRPISPATVSTLAADALSAGAERLNGLANPQAADTAAWFEWGTTTNYGNITPPQSLGSGMVNTNFSAVISGLTVDDTYHYRAVVSNSLGVVFGNDRNFRTLDAYLKASNTETDDNFGFSVAASGDIVVIGVIDEDSNATGVNGNQVNNGAVSSGAAYVFVRSGDSWMQQAYLKASNTEANDLFGFSVAVSGDTIAVSAIGESSNATGVNGNQSNNSSVGSGATYVFVRNGTNWTQQAYLKASNTGAGDQFGTSVALSGDTLVVGARLEDSNTTGINGNGSDNSAAESGAAYVFRRSGTNWIQQAYLKASNTGATDQFGNSVAVSGDLVVVGAFSEDSNAIGVNGDGSDNSASGSGAAYVFARTGTIWTQQAYLKASNTEPGDSFGTAVAVSGETIVVGADAEDSNATGVNGSQNNNGAINSGAAYVFVRSGTNWSQQAYLKASNTEASDFFGDSVSVSGNTIVVGAPFEDGNATGFNGNQTNNSASVSGAAYVFVHSGTNWIQQDYLKASNAESGDIFADTVAVSGGTIVIGATGESSNATGVNGDQNNNSAPISGAAYVFSTLIPPTLTIAPSGVSQVTLSWSPTTPGFALQETLTLAPVSWSNSPSGPTNPITLPASSEARFFRLIRP